MKSFIITYLVAVYSNDFKCEISQEKTEIITAKDFDKAHDKAKSFLTTVKGFKKGGYWTVNSHKVINSKIQIHKDQIQKLQHEIEEIQFKCLHPNATIVNSVKSRCPDCEKVYYGS
jgi:hypothetical protein